MLKASSLFLGAENSSHAQDRTKAQKASTRPVSKLDKLLSTCTSKSPHAFVRILCVRHPSGWSWNGLAGDFCASTFWSEKTSFFVLAWQNLTKLGRKLCCAAETRRTLRWIYSSCDLKVEDLKTVWLLTSWCHHGGWHKPEFLIVDFSLHAAPKIALRSWKSPRAPLTMRTNIQPKGGSQSALVVNVLLKQSECTHLGCAYKILNSVGASHSTHVKITVPIV